MRVLGLIFAPFAFGLCLLGLLFRRKEQEQPLEDLAQETSLERRVQDEIDEDDDWRRRWLQDKGPLDRLATAEMYWAQQAVQVVPEVPFEIWLIEQRAKKKKKGCA